MKDLLVVTACLADNTEPITRLEESCQYNNLDFAYYGVKERFVNWKDAKVTRLIEFLKTNEQEYKYVAYTDGFDSWALKGADEILNRFSLHNTRLLIAGEINNYPLHLDFKDCETIFRYPCAGQFMGEIREVIDALEVMKTRYNNYDIHNHRHNDQALWQIYTLQEGVMIDHDADIFLSAGGLPLTKLYFTDEDACNSYTKESACFVHFNGPKGGSDNERNMNLFYDLWLNVRGKYD